MENKEAILEKLHNDDPEVQADAIKMIKTTGDLSIATDLLDFLLKTEDIRIKTTLISLLADVKDKNFADILMTYIKQTLSNADKSVLLQICWESSLDFSLHAEYFAGLLIEGDFAVALEASTILENMENIDTKCREKIISSLGKAKISDESQAVLVDETIKYFRDYEL